MDNCKQNHDTSSSTNNNNMLKMYDIKAVNQPIESMIISELLRSQ
jgi:hypothetical protein